MKYEVVFTKKALKSFIKLPNDIKTRVTIKLEQLARDPYGLSNIKKLSGIDGAYRLRIGEYRIVYYLLDDKLVINIIKIGHRREVYK